MYFFNFGLSIMLSFGIISNKNDGPLNNIENTNEDVNIFFILVSISGVKLFKSISPVNDIESNKNENTHINITIDENLVITSISFDVR